MPIWHMRVLDDDHRVTFLREVQRQLGANWQPVIDAILDGRATHLTDLEQDGILSSPLGLSIAARAYSPTRLATSRNRQRCWMATRARTTCGRASFVNASKRHTPIPGCRSRRSRSQRRRCSGGSARSQPDVWGTGASSVPRSSVDPADHGGPFRARSMHATCDPQRCSALSVEGGLGLSTRPQ